MKELLKDLIVELTGTLLLQPALFITSLAYNLQVFLVKDMHVKDHNIEFELNGIVIKKQEKVWMSSRHLNNYTAQDISLQPMLKNGYLVSLNIPIENKEEAYSIQSEMVERFKKDEYFTGIK